MRHLVIKDDTTIMIFELDMFLITSWLKLKQAEMIKVANSGQMADRCKFDGQ